MVCQVRDCHPSQHYPGLMLINFVGATIDVNHYTKPPTSLDLWYYYYHTHLMTFFQDNLGKSVPDG